MRSDHPKPHNGGRPTAYGLISDQLRREISAGVYPRDVPLPTEMELSKEHQVSRQTVRRAFQDLVSEGLVYRVPGRGTFVTANSGRYIRSTGTIDDLLSLARDTDLDIVEPVHEVREPLIAQRLGLTDDIVATTVFRRIHDNRPYCLTHGYYPPEIGRLLAEIPEMRTSGLHPRMTVLELIPRVTGRAIAGADQTITATAADATVASALDGSVGDPVLRIDRLYFDRAGMLLALSVNHFNPERYAYRFQMKANG